MPTKSRKISKEETRKKTVSSSDNVIKVEGNSIIDDEGARSKVILSPAAALAFSNLHKRLGLGSPSRTVFWLLHQASDAITRLPENFHFDLKERDDTIEQYLASGYKEMETRLLHKNHVKQRKRIEARKQARERARNRTLLKKRLPFLDREREG